MWNSSEETKDSYDLKTENTTWGQRWLRLPARHGSEEEQGLTCTANYAPSWEERDSKWVGTEWQTGERRNNKELMFWGCMEPQKWLQRESLTSYLWRGNLGHAHTESGVFNTGMLWALSPLLEDSHKQHDPTQIIPVPQLAHSWERKESVLVSQRPQPS